MTAQKPLHILLADDDEDDREFFSEAMHEVAPQVKISTSVDGGSLMKRLTAPAALLPDLIFLDVNMPFKSGLECLTELRKIPKFNAVPLIMYSTTDNPDQVEQAYKAGANLYVKKPQHFAAIKALLDKLLSVDLQSYILQPGMSQFVFH